MRRRIWRRSGSRLTQKCFSKGHSTSKDPNDASVANFWVKQMTRYTLTLRAKFAREQAEFCKSLDEYVAQYFRFVCTKLLDVEVVNEAQEIAASMAPILELPELLTPLGKTVLELLTEHNPTEKDCTAKATALHLSAQGDLFRSKLWAAMQYEQQASTVKGLKNFTSAGDHMSFLATMDIVASHSPPGLAE